jgi:hypothetical protein
MNFLKGFLVMNEVWKICTIEDFKGSNWFQIEVYGEVREGGSNSYTSDEPPWREVTLTDIWNIKRRKYVSNKVKRAILEKHGDDLIEELSDEYDRW